LFRNIILLYLTDTLYSYIFCEHFVMEDVKLK
jgi:hypothetical protein